MDDSFRKRICCCGRRKKLVKTGDTISVSKGAKHLIHAQTDMNIIEIQIGESISVKDKHIFLETF